MKIVDKLKRMNVNMSEYTMDVEDKLERAYGGAGGNAMKKYGFEKLAARNSDMYTEGSVGASTGGGNWELNKMQK